MKIIAHLDMDAFFATAELIRDPRLQGLPVAVGGRSNIEPLAGNEFPVLSQYTGRGVLTTANYEARKLGLHSAMPTMKAAKLAPHAILLPADFEWYKHLSRCFKTAVRDVVPWVEDRGVDEIYIDLSEASEGNFDQAVDISRRLKIAVTQATGGMTCSIGLSANKMTSKICSDLQKPDGLSVVRPEQFQSIIWPLPVGKINGVGPKAREKLLQMNVQTVAELAACDRTTLIDRFGQSYGAWLHDCAWGIDNRELSYESDPKSMSRETTFEKDMHVLRDRTDLTAVLTRLTNRLAEDLHRRELKARTIGIKVRFGNFKSLTRDHTVQMPIADSSDLLETARLCLKKVPFTRTGMQSSIRLLGVKASGFGEHSPEPDNPQLSLFEA
ncbi:MAG: DNA polymerase IV [Limnobacter sp.]|nr:DNA polymerase IV [Limnobacter sp.]